MEFFEYLTIPQIIIQLFRNGSGITLEELYILMGVAGGCYLVCLIFGGLALFAMAERAGIKHSWLGFLPFVNTYYAGKIAGETSCFGHKMKRAGLYAMLAEIVYATLEILYLVSNALLADPAYYETTFGETTEINFIAGNVPAGLLWMSNASVWFSTLGMIANLVMILFFCIVYNTLFRKYSPQRSYVLTVFAVLLPVRAFLLFAVRNRVPVDYAAYMQERLERMMRQSGFPVNGIPRGTNEDPFEEFPTRRPDPSPFEEFNDPPAADGGNVSEAPAAPEPDSPGEEESASPSDDSPQEPKNKE